MTKFKLKIMLNYYHLDNPRSEQYINDVNGVEPNVFAKMIQNKLCFV